MKIKTLFFISILFSFIISHAYGYDEVLNSGGTLTVRQIDHIIASPLGSIPLSRSFQTDTSDGILGPGWRLDIISKLEKVTSNLIIATQAGDPVLLVKKDKTDIFEGPGDIQAKFSGRYWIVSSPSGTLSVYNSAGLELTRSDIHKNTLNFVYDIYGRLSRILSSGNSDIRLKYNQFGKLSELEDNFKQKCIYKYGPDGFLKNVKDFRGWETTFKYSKNGKISQIHYPTGEQLTFKYNEKGQVARRHSSFGSRTRYTYGKAHRITRQDGYWIETEYSKTGQPLIQRDSLGRIQQWVWNEQGKLSKKTCFDKSTIQYFYDDKGRMVGNKTSAGDRLTLVYEGHTSKVRQINRNGAVTSFNYDKQGNLISQVSPAGRKTTFKYDQMGRRISTIDAEGRTTNYEYDIYGNRIKQINPDNGVNAWQYNSSGQVTKATDPLGNVTQVSYEPGGLVSSVTHPDGSRTQYAYDPYGQLEQVSDGLSNLHLKRDPAGRLTRIDYPDKTFEAISWDDRGNPITFTNASGLSLKMEYDQLDRLVGQTSPTGLKTKNTYSESGRLASISTGKKVTRITSDPRTRTLQLLTSDSVTAGIVTDPWGRVIRRILPSGGHEQRRYDPDGLLTAVFRPMGGNWKYVYNQAGQLLKITFPDTTTRQIDYDTAGRPSKIVYPTGEKVVTNYDLNGRPIEIINARGQKTEYRYDINDRVVRKKTDKSIWNYTYDSSGKLLQAGNGTYTIRHSYDINGRLERTEIPQWGKTIQYQYDTLGRMIKRLYPGGHEIQYSYNKLGNISKIFHNSGLAFEFQYDQQGRLIEKRANNGQKSNFRYDSSGNILSVFHKDASGKPIAARKFQYDKQGNRTGVEDEKKQIRTFVYDKEQRLVEESGPSGRNAYIYDPSGKRTSVAGKTGIQSYLYDEAGQLVQAGDESFTWDPDGNILSRKNRKGTTRYFYDSENHLVKVQLPGNKEVNYGYGPFGNRIWRQEGSERIYYLFDGDHVCQELGPGFNTATSYFYSGLDRPLASFSSKGIPRLYFEDALGSILAISNIKGKILARFQYDAFGNIVKEEGGDDRLPFRFTGRPFDSATGLIDLRARFYDPNLGQFTSRDPFFGQIGNPPTFLTYSYAYGNPVSFVDPFGAEGTIGNINIDNALYFRRAPVVVPGMDEIDVLRTNIAKHIYDKGLTRTPPPGVHPVSIPASGWERAAGAIDDSLPDLAVANGQTIFELESTGVSASSSSDLGGITKLDPLQAIPRTASTGSASGRIGNYLRTKLDALNQAVPAAQKAGHTAGMGNLAMAVTDIVAEPMSAALYGEDASAALGKAAKDISALTLTGAVSGQVVSGGANLLMAAAPAAAPLIITGGAVISTAALAYGAGNRIGTARQERLAAEQAEREVIQAIRGGENHKKFRAKQVDIIDKLTQKIRKIKELVPGDMNELESLELEVANRRNLTDSNSITDSDIKGIDERVMLMQKTVSRWQEAKKEYDLINRSLKNLKQFGGIAEDISELGEKFNTISLPDVEKGTRLLALALQNQYHVRTKKPAPENEKVSGWKMLGSMASEEIKKETEQDSGWGMVGTSDDHETPIETQSKKEEANESGDFVNPGSLAAEDAINETEQMRPQGRRYALRLKKFGEKVEIREAKAQQFFKESMADNAQAITNMAASNLKKKTGASPAAPQPSYNIRPVGPSYNPADGWGKPGEVPTGPVKCPVIPSVKETKCKQANEYIRMHKSLAEGSKVWNARLQRVYLFRAQCCGYRWSTDSGEDMSSFDSDDSFSDGGLDGGLNLMDNLILDDGEGANSSLVIRTPGSDGYWWIETYDPDTGNKIRKRTNKKIE